MTERVLVDTKHLGTKALFISFVWHFLCLSLFTFTFRPYAVSQKPLLVFLGSILRKNDLLITYREIPPLYDVDKTPPSERRIELPSDANQISRYSPVQKPFMLRLEDKNSKKPFKPPLQTNTEEVNVKNKQETEPDIPAPPRLPLRLYQNDSN